MSKQGITAAAELHISSSRSKRRVLLVQSLYRIGRQEDNDIVIDDKKASRRHCVLERDGEAFVLRDLSSRNGTWVGTERVREVRLSVGEEFRIGGTEFRILAGGDPGRSAPAPTAVSGGEVIDIPAPKRRKPPPERKSEFPMRLSGPVDLELRPLREAASALARTKDRSLTLREAKLLDRESKPRDSASVSEETAAALLEIVLTAIQIGVSDIFVEPGDESIALRARIDGMLQPMAQLSKPLGLALLTAIKSLCRIDLTKQHAIQEGTFFVALPGRTVTLRVSIMPVSSGQKAAIRILDKASIPDELSGLGMDDALGMEMRRALAADSGIIVVSGPTGSGKTTTLYSALQGIDAKRRNVVTIEDPIEYRLEHATQIAIDPSHGVTFATVLSSIMRQDPDVIFVGEMRDKETAELAMQAGSTGHLVLTTVHARDAIGTVFRLLDLGLEPFQIANSVTMAISQRLVRLLCTHCKQSFRPEARLVRDLKLDERQAVELFAPVGCVRCMQTGFHGRIAIFEAMRFTPALRDVILRRPTVSDIRKAAGDWLFRTLADSGRQKVLEGLTSFDEVARVASGD